MKREERSLGKVEAAAAAAQGRSDDWMKWRVDGWMRLGRG